MKLKEKRKLLNWLNCHDNSWSVWHGNEYYNVDMICLGRINLLRCCCRASVGIAIANAVSK